MKQTRLSGNALSEYGLVGLLVLGFAILGMLALGTSIRQQFSNFNASLQAHTGAMHRPLASAGSLIAAPRANALNTMPVSLSSYFSPGSLAAFGSGGTSALAVGAAIQTVGANGATNTLLASLETQIQQMKAEGKIDDVQANQLQQLANQGHSLADAQKALETAFVQGKATVTYDGKTYPIAQFNEKLSMTTVATPSTLKKLDPAQCNAFLQPFAAAYQSIKQTGTALSPEVRKTVGKLVYQISVVNDTLNWTALDTIDAGYPKVQPNGGFTASTVDHYIQDLGDKSVTVASLHAFRVTNADSGQICTTGAGSDTGAHCAKP